MNEESFVRQLAASLPQGPDVTVGPGDDCAVLDFGFDELVLAAADQVVEDVHYLASKSSPADVARKLLNRNVSDIASMGGRPTHALVTIALMPVDEKWLSSFHDGLKNEASSYGISIIGGDIASSGKPGHFCSLSILGRVSRKALCLRCNARPGDLLFGTGSFGGSFASGRHINFTPRLAEAQFLAGRFTHAMIDVSDGLLKDSCRMAEASGLALELDLGKIPCASGVSIEAALSDGEDYELLFAVPPSVAEELKNLWPFKDLPLSQFGRFIEGPRGSVSGCDGLPLKIGKSGFDHFHE